MVLVTNLIAKFVDLSDCLERSCVTLVNLTIKSSRVVDDNFNV